jgi:uncharacterized protein YciI
MKRAVPAVLGLAALALLAAAQPKGPQPGGQAAHQPPPLFYLVTFTPGETWVKDKSLLEQPEVMKHMQYWSPRTATAEEVASGLLEEGKGGEVAIIQAGDLAAAKKLAEEDPSVKSKLLKVEVRPWRAISWMGQVDLPGAAAKYQAGKAKPAPAGK